MLLLLLDSHHRPPATPEIRLEPARAGALESTGPPEACVLCATSFVPGPVAARAVEDGQDRGPVCPTCALGEADAIRSRLRGRAEVHRAWVERLEALATGEIRLPDPAAVAEARRALGLARH